MSVDVLLVIDMQNAIFAGEIARFDAEGVIGRINRLATAVRHHGGRVIFIQHDGTEAEELLPQSSGWQILTALNVDASDGRLRKTACDAFYRTELQVMLSAVGLERLIITGCASDFCVDTTVRAAAGRDFDVVVAADGHTTGDRPHLGAEEITRHHNWMWENLSCPTTRSGCAPRLTWLLQWADRWIFMAIP